MNQSIKLNVRTTQVPGELAQYNGWTGPELLGLVGRLETENKQLKTLLARAADALEALASYASGNPDAYNILRLAEQQLIAELRKAAQ